MKKSKLTKAFDSHKKFYYKPKPIKALRLHKKFFPRSKTGRTLNNYKKSYSKSRNQLQFLMKNKYFIQEFAVFNIDSIFFFRINTLAKKRLFKIRTVRNRKKTR